MAAQHAETLNKVEEKPWAGVCQGRLSGYTFHGPSLAGSTLLRLWPQHKHSGGSQGVAGGGYLSDALFTVVLLKADLSVISLWLSQHQFLSKKAF